MIEIVAFFTAVPDLHELRCEPLAIGRDSQPWTDRAAIDRCYAACREDLEQRPNAVPRVLEDLGARERGGDAATG
jgi:hypothetical protein